MDLSPSLVGFLLICSSVMGAYTAVVPLHINEGNRYSEEVKEEGRIFWGPVGTMIESLPFLPITINVPDLIYGAGDLLVGAYNYFFGGSDSSAPRIWKQILKDIDGAIS